MPSTLLPHSTTTRAIQVWLSNESPQSGDADARRCLTAAERRLADRFRSMSRRRSFEVARWLGKQAARPWLETNDWTEAFERIEILSEDPAATTSRPGVCFDGVPADVNISITHLDQTVAVAVTDRECPIGLDLAQIQLPSQGFSAFWMTHREKLQVDQSRDPALTAAMNWSVREAAFKATRVDDEFRPVNWSVSFSGDRAACFHQGQLQPMHFSFYRISNDLLLTVASEQADIIFRSATEHCP